MYKKEKVVTMDENIVGFTCDRCLEEFYDDNFVEMQEHVCINVFGGYGSVFGDGSELQGTFCQGCIEKTLGKYLKEIPEPVDSSDEHKKKYDQYYGDSRVCVCGHSYYWHFNNPGEMRCECKYCNCDEFEEAE